MRSILRVLRCESAGHTDHTCQKSAMEQTVLATILAQEGLEALEDQQAIGHQQDINRYLIMINSESYEAGIILVIFGDIWYYLVNESRPCCLKCRNARMAHDRAMN